MITVEARKEDRSPLTINFYGEDKEEMVAIHEMVVALRRSGFTVKVTRDVKVEIEQE